MVRGGEKLRSKVADEGNKRGKAIKWPEQWSHVTSVTAGWAEGGERVSEGRDEEGSPAHFPLVPHDGADHEQCQQQQQEQRHHDGGSVCRREGITLSQCLRGWKWFCYL